uniref:Putative ovule protein n=1 Tax=Solanum chacoense TaxID=4108 RepID=A0A0V0IDA4_SOLCH
MKAFNWGFAGKTYLKNLMLFLRKAIWTCVKTKNDYSLLFFHGLSNQFLWDKLILHLYLDFCLCIFSIPNPFFKSYLERNIQ